MAADGDRLQRQLDFALEIDKLKQVFRQTWLLDASRKENDAEHSWHIALMAALLVEHADLPNLDLSRVVRMLLVHDLVEIDAGDTYAYDAVGVLDQAERERKAADRVFSLLPLEQCSDLRTLWEEFDARLTPEARYAAAIDRLQPFLHNYHTQGKAWRENRVTSRQVYARMRPVADASLRLWELTEQLILDAVRRGYLAE